MATVQQLEEKIAELTRQNEILGMENEMLAHYLSRDADRGSGTEDADEAIADMPLPADKVKDRKGQQQRGRGQAARQVRLPTSLSLEDKYLIANQEVDAITEDIEQTKRTSDQNLDILRALMEETNIRTAEVKRDTYEFRRDIVVGAENPRTGKTMAERVLKYMEDKLTQKDMLISKMINKNQAYRAAIKKAQHQLQSKQETGDDLQFIDFLKLQIENQQFMTRIEEAYQELTDLKRRSSRTMKIQNNMKKRLNTLTTEAKSLQEEIKERKAMLAKVEQDTNKVLEEKEAARKEQKKLQLQRKHTPEVRDGLDYVEQKAEMHELEAQKRNWDRKLEIAETSVRRIRTKMRNETQLPGM